MKRSESCGTSLTMQGSIHPKDSRCPTCQAKYVQNSKHGYECPRCRRVPDRYLISFYWGKHRLRLTSDLNDEVFTSHRVALRQLEVMRSEVDQKIFDPKKYLKSEARRLRFENYAEAWLERRREEVNNGDLSREYWRSVAVYVRKYLVPGFQGHSIADLRTHHLEDFLSKTLPRTLKPKTRSNIIAVLRKMLRDAHRRQEIALVPAVPSVKQEDHQIRWLWEQEQELILDKIDDPVRRIFFLFMMRQGVRPGEARALQWDRIDIYREVEIGPGRTIKGVVIIDAAMDQDTFRPRTKTGRIRILPLHPEVREALLQIPGREGYVFQFRNKPFNRKLVDKTWRRAALAAGFEGVTCYQGTRHSAASQAINSGCDLKTIKDFLGHADLRTTNRYAHLLTGTLAKVWDRPQGAETSPEPPKPAKVIHLHSRRKVTG